MYRDGENVFYYITMMNENYPQPALPEGAEEGIRKGMYLFQQGGKGKNKVQLMGAGTIFREVIAAADLLKQDWKVDADIWGCPSFNELRRDGLSAERHNLLHPEDEPKTSWVAQQLKGYKGPAVAATDYMKAVPDQIRGFMDRPFYVLGTDGFGRSDTREQLRHHFEVDRYFVTVAALKALADNGQLEAATVTKAIKKYGIDPEKTEPLRA